MRGKSWIATCIFAGAVLAGPGTGAELARGQETGNRAPGGAARLSPTVLHGDQIARICAVYDRVYKSTRALSSKTNALCWFLDGEQGFLLSGIAPVLDSTAKDSLVSQLTGPASDLWDLLLSSTEAKLFRDEARTSQQIAALCRKLSVTNVTSSDCSDWKKALLKSTEQLKALLPKDALEQQTALDTIQNQLNSYTEKLSKIQGYTAELKLCETLETYRTLAAKMIQANMVDQIIAQKLDDATCNTLEDLLRHSLKENTKECCRNVRAASQAACAILKAYTPSVDIPAVIKQFKGYVDVIPGAAEGVNQAFQALDMLDEKERPHFWYVYFAAGLAALEQELLAKRPEADRRTIISAVYKLDQAAHIEPMWIYKIGQKLVYKNLAYFFSYKDMCENCRNFIGAWAKGRNAPLLVFSKESKADTLGTPLSRVNHVWDGEALQAEDAAGRTAQSPTDILWVYQVRVNEPMGDLRVMTIDGRTWYAALTAASEPAEGSEKKDAT